MAILGKTTLLSGECYNNFKIGGTLLLQTDGLSNIPSVTTSDKNVVQADGYVVAKGFKVPSGTSTQLLTANGTTVDLDDIYTTVMYIPPATGGQYLPVYVNSGNQFQSCSIYDYNTAGLIKAEAQVVKLPRQISMNIDSNNLGVIGCSLNNSGIYSFVFSGTQGTTGGKAASISCRNGFYQTSDKRKKTNFRDLDLNKCYEMIEKCQTVLFDWKDGSGKDQMGVIAQEVEEFFPEIVSNDENGYKSVDYAKLAVVCMRVLKDLIDKVNG